MITEIELKPQGPQQAFIESKAEIVIFGGSAGGGKSYALLLDPLRFYNFRLDLTYTIFRRTTPQIRNPGALFEEAGKMYLPMLAEPNSSHLYYKFQQGLKIKFAHMENESNVYDWHGAQLDCIGFDELTQFTEHQFFYMLSRLRGSTGLGGYVRATCNPDPDSFVRKLIDWWIGEDGFAIPERSGVIRWFERHENELIWHDRKVNDKCKSITFIRSRLEDNKILNEKNPGYRANLEALPYVERMRLLEGNWNIRPAAGNYFKKHYFEIVDALPANTRSVRYWDRAATKKDKSDWTAGVKIHRAENGLFFISDVRRFRGSPLEVRDAIKNTAIMDTPQTIVGIEQDPGQAGVVEAEDYVRLLAGFSVKLCKVSTDKVSRASPFSSQCEARNVKVLRGTWNDAYFNELESFPQSTYDDQVDASSGGFNLLTQGLAGQFGDQFTKKTPTHAQPIRGKNQW